MRMAADEQCLEILVSVARFAPGPLRTVSNKKRQPLQVGVCIDAIHMCSAKDGGLKSALELD